MLWLSKSGRLSGLPLFFLHDLWYNIPKETRPASQRCALGRVIQELTPCSTEN
nr:MAG TPA: hypothetical protein [Caudoviricetes sp.]